MCVLAVGEGGWGCRSGGGGGRDGDKQDPGVDCEDRIFTVDLELSKMLTTVFTLTIRTDRMSKQRRPSSDAAFCSV